MYIFRELKWNLNAPGSVPGVTEPQTKITKRRGAFKRRGGKTRRPNLATSGQEDLLNVIICPSPPGDPAAPTWNRTYQDGEERSPPTPDNRQIRFNPQTTRKTDDASPQKRSQNRQETAAAILCCRHRLEPRYRNPAASNHEQSSAVNHDTSSCFYSIINDVFININTCEKNHLW